MYIRGVVFKICFEIGGGFLSRYDIDVSRKGFKLVTHNQFTILSNFLSTSTHLLLLFIHKFSQHFSSLYLPHPHPHPTSFPTFSTLSTLYTAYALSFVFPAAFFSFAATCVRRWHSPNAAEINSTSVRSRDRHRKWRRDSCSVSRRVMDVGVSYDTPRLVLECEW